MRILGLSKLFSTFFSLFDSKSFVFSKNHARAMDSMQASLESEQRAKAEALRIKKKLEGDINELEIALDHANKANSEAQKVNTYLQVHIYHQTNISIGDQALPRPDEGG